MCGVGASWDVARLSRSWAVVLGCGLVMGREPVLHVCVVPGRTVVRTEFKELVVEDLGVPVWRAVGGGEETLFDVP